MTGGKRRWRSLSIAEETKRRWRPLCSSGLRQACREIGCMQAETVNKDASWWLCLNTIKSAPCTIAGTQCSCFCSAELLQFRSLPHLQRSIRLFFSESTWTIRESNFFRTKIDERIDNLWKSANIYVKPCETSKTTYTSIWQSMNTHENLRASDQYGAAGSQTLVPSTWGGALVWWFLKGLRRQPEIISKLWNINGN